jgi:hypothetical protein
LSERAEHNIASDYGITVDSLPDGFKEIAGQSVIGSIDIFCAKCDVSAVEWPG